MVFDYIEVSGSPYQMGKTFGTLRAAQIHALLQKTLAPLDRRDAFRRAMAYIPVYRRYAPDMLAELEGMAEGAGLTMEESLLMQTRWDLGRAPVGDCTSFAVSAPVTRDGGFYAGINKDVPEASRENLVLVHMKPDHGPRKLIAAYNGSMAGPAMNEHGVCFFGNSLYGGRTFTGVPQPIGQRLVVEQTSVDAVLEVKERLYREGLPGGPGNYTIADGAGNAACVETLDGEYEVIRLGERGYLSHANNVISANAHMLAVEESWHSGNTKGRQGRLEELFHQHRGKVDVPCLQAILSDHAGLPFSICRHDATNLDGITSLTAMSFIAEPKAGRCWLCKGNPCENPYTCFEV